MRRVVIACLLLGACARGPSARSPSPAVAEPASAAPPVVSCARRTGGVRPVARLRRAAGKRRRCSRAHGDRLLAYVADADSRSLHTIDVDAGKRARSHARSTASPASSSSSPTGASSPRSRTAPASRSSSPRADPSAPLASLCTRDVPAEPWGVALSPDDAKLVVTSAWGSALTVLDASTFDVRARRAAAARPARRPRTTTASPSSAHLVGAQDERRRPRQGRTTRRRLTSPSASRRRCAAQRRARACAPGRRVTRSRASRSPERPARRGRPSASWCRW